MAKAIHMMIRVGEEARSVAFYRAAFALEVADRFDFDDFTLVYMRNAEADFELELTINKGRTEPYEIGNGYGHLAFCVDDLEAARNRCTAAGLTPKDIKEMNHQGRPLARFFFIEDPDGHKIEVLQRSGRYR